MSETAERRSSLATIMFTDVVGSTAMRQRLGDVEADRLQVDLDGVVSAPVEAHDGWVVKRLGDGVLAAFSGAADALAAASDIQIAMQRRFRNDEHCPSLRIGLSAGDVAWLDDDCHGTPVVEAARLCDAANAGQILLADIVRALAGSRTDLRLESIGSLDLKGLSEPTGACELIVKNEPITAAGLPAHLRPEQGRPFVGRKTEEQELDELVAAVGERQGKVVFVTGEPGIGKSSLLRSVAERVALDDWTVLYGACTRSTASAYQPFVEALEEHLSRTADSDLRLGSMSGELGRLAPELASRVDLSRLVLGDADTERARLLDSVSRWIIATAERRPLLLVLDDLHWAGPATATMVEHLARSITDAPILVVAAYRDAEIDRAHPMSSVIGDVRRFEHVHQLPLRGFDEQDVVEFLTSYGGVELDEIGRRFASRLHAETEGHPFFVRETLLHMVQTGALARSSDGSWESDVELSDVGLSDGVREMVRRRLDALSSDAIDVLTSAAVIGERFAYDILVASCDLGRKVIADAIDQAERVQLIEPEPGQVLEYRFGHSLIRAVLEDDLSAVRRAQINGLVGEAICTLRAQKVEENAAAIAHHFVEASRLGESGRAIDWCTRAGAVARRRAAFDEGARWYSMAVELDELDPETTPGRRAGLLSRLGHAMSQAGEPGVKEILDQAVELAEEAQDGPTMARALLLSTTGFADFDPRERSRRIDLSKRALKLLGSDEADLRARLLASQCGAEKMSGDPNYVQTGISASEALAATTNPSTHVHAGGQVALALSNRNEIDAGAMLRRAKASAEAADVPELILAANHYLVTDLARRGRANELRQLIESEVPQLPLASNPIHHCYHELNQAYIACDQGNFESALIHAGECRVYADQIGSADLQRLPPIIDAWIAFLRDETKSRSHEARRVAVELPDNPSILFVAIADNASPDAVVDLALNHLWMGMDCYTCWYLWEHRAVDAAIRFGPTIRETGSRFLSTGTYIPLPTSWGVGLLDAVIGDSDLAVANLESAIELCVSNELVPHAARVKVDCAEVRIALGVDVVRAGELLEQAIPECRGIGMGHTTERAEMLLDSL